VARILVSTPMPPGCLDALAGHELVPGEPGSDELAEALVCDPTQPVDAAAIARLPRLRVIGVAGAGTDAVDTSAAAARGVPVLSAGEPLVQTTADLAFGLIIAACRLMHDAEATLRKGAWRGWRFIEDGPGADVPPFGRDVHGARLGLVGFGAIGRAVAVRAEAFAMEIRHHTRSPTGEAGWTESLDELLAWSEIVSLHLPLSESSRGLIDARRIGLLGPEGVLVNTARGAVLDEDALAEALEQGGLFAAGLDVYAHEPEVSPRLLRAPRTVLLPHIGSATLATRRAMLATIAGKVAAFLTEADAGR
jgi:glyoxylate reductase